MRNKKEWFSAEELRGIAGLPTSSQGINKKARTKKWEKRSREGVQGGAVEYHYSSLPFEVQQALGFEPQEKISMRILSETMDLIAAIKALEERVRELEHPQNTDQLNDEQDDQERELIKCFRQCDEAGKAMILSIAKTIIEQLKSSKEHVEIPAGRVA